MFRVNRMALCCQLLLMLLLNGLALSKLSLYADSIEVAGYGRVANGRVLDVSDEQLVFQIPGRKAQTYARNQVTKIVYEPIRIDMTEPLEPRLNKHEANKPSSKKKTTSKNGLKVADLFKTHGEVRFAFPSQNSSYDPAVFRFSTMVTGETSQSIYAGLFNYPNRDTFRMELPQPQQGRGQLKFNLYGVFKTQSYPESYLSRVVFLDPHGRIVATSPVLHYGGDGEKNSVQPQFFEWLRDQNGQLGLSEKRPVDLIVPAGTKTIAFQTSTPQSSSVHLVGFISNITFEPNYQGQDQLIRFESLETASR